MKIIAAPVEMIAKFKPQGHLKKFELKYELQTCIWILWKMYEGLVMLERFVPKINFLLT